MNDGSTIAWMIMGGPRYDERTQAELDHRRALEEQRFEATRAGSPGWLTRLAGFLDGWHARTDRTANYCTADACVAG